MSGLDYACAAPQYLHAAWLKDYWRLPGGPNEYLRRWYVPLLKCGYQVPFFLVLDLGLFFLDGLRFSRYADAATLDAEGQQLRTLYAHFFNQLREQPVMRKLLDTVERDGRYKKLLMRQHDPLSGRLEAVPAFVKLCLIEWETRQSPSFLIDPHAVQNLDEARWREAADRLEHHLSAVKDTSTWRQWGSGEDPNRSFLRAFLKDTLPSALTVSPAAGQIIRATCLGATQCADLDLLLLSNYTQYHLLDEAAFSQQELGPLQRAASAVSIPTHSTARLGGYHGISYEGAWSSLVHSQLALLDQHESLFLHKYYDHKVLYYERRSPKTRPLSLLLAVLVDTGPALHRRLPGEGYYNALTREVAAYLVEDVARHLGALQLNLDVYLACFPASEGRPGIFFSARESSLDRHDDKPLLTQRLDTLDDFFRLDPPRAAAVDPIAASGEPDRLAALRRFKQRLATELAERTRRGEGVTSYDCLHLVIVTAEQPAPPQDLVQELSAGLATRSRLLHWLALDDHGVTWSTARAPSRLLEQSARESYAQLRTAQSIRRQFLKIVIQEAVRSSALI